MNTSSISQSEIWIAAARPKTLAAAIVPVMVGASLAYDESSLNIVFTVIALLVALLIQIGTNFANDLYDYLKGADSKKRIGPLRVLNEGLVTPSQMKTAIALVFGAAFLLGLYVVTETSYWLLLAGVISILSGMAYTSGPYPLAYNGLGDIFVFIFFGIVATTGTYYVNTGDISLAVIIASFPAGLLITNILVVNNYRDAEQDSAAGKNTLVVLLGKRFARFQYISSVMVSFAVPVYLHISGNQTEWIYIVFISMPVSIILIKNFLSKTGAELNTTLENTAKFSALFGLLYSLGILL